MQLLMIYTISIASLTNCLQFLIACICYFMRNSFELNLKMKNFIKQIFTWWNRQTLGTFLYTIFRGKFVGKDEFGNKYFQSSKGKRWIIYKTQVEATKIPPRWYSWIHFMTDKNPNENIEKQYSWQLSHTENLTGTDKAYKPKGILTSENLEPNKKYDSWKP